jgi:mannose/cellobiose epimerase-like protein (N-acyl-D-glucosamine 2-epimerase family)
MKKYLLLNILLIILLTHFSIFAKEVSIEASQLPSGEEWMRHLYRDLLPFWSTPAAMGSPIGNFPSFRYNDGTVVDPLQPLRDEYAQLLDEKSSAWIADHVDRRYVRMISRQIYLYGVAYHLTGDQRWLRLAKAGVTFLLENMQAENGAFYSWIANGKGQLALEQRTSQDMAYSLLGLSFYYYLTRDQVVLSAILRAKNFIFQTYAEDDWRELHSISPHFNKQQVKQRRLSVQLDQINAYMLLLTPILPKNTRPIWEKELKQLAIVMIEDYYSATDNVFWERIMATHSQQLETVGANFGTTIKSFWMLYLIGKTFSEPQWVAFALKNAPKVFEEAFIKEIGAWGEKKLPDGQMVKNRVWWIYAELDQMAATLSLTNSAYLRFLVPTYQYWFAHFIDQQYGGIWHQIDAKTNKPQLPKVHLWKNGYHSFEHALVGYITAQAIRQQPVELYFAFEKLPHETDIHPYYFQGSIKQIKVTEFDDFIRYKVWFEEIN